MENIALPCTDEYNVCADPFVVMKLHVVKKLTERGYFAYEDERDDCFVVFESMFIQEQSATPTCPDLAKNQLLVFKHDTLHDYIKTTARHLSRSWTLLQFIGNRKRLFESGKHRAVITVVACYGFGAVHVGHVIQTTRRCATNARCAAQHSVLATSNVHCGMFLNLLKNKPICDRTEDYFTAPSAHPLPGLICCHMTHTDELEGTFDATELPALPPITSVARRQKGR